LPTRRSSDLSKPGAGWTSPAGNWTWAGRNWPSCGSWSASASGTSWMSSGKPTGWRNWRLRSTRPSATMNPVAGRFCSGSARTRTCSCGWWTSRRPCPGLGTSGRPSPTRRKTRFPCGSGRPRSASPPWTWKRCASRTPPLQLEKAENDYRIAELNAQQAERTFVNSVRTAFHNVTDAARRLETAAVDYELAKAEYDVARRHQDGLTTDHDVERAADELRSAEHAHHDA